MKTIEEVEAVLQAVQEEMQQAIQSLRLASLERRDADFKKLMGIVSSFNRAIKVLDELICLIHTQQLMDRLTGACAVPQERRTR